MCELHIGKDIVWLASLLRR